LLLTSYGLSSNFEAGALLGHRDAWEADEVVRSLEEAGLVRMVFVPVPDAMSNGIKTLRAKRGPSMARVLPPL
jgi:hypothetical protein